MRFSLAQIFIGFIGLIIAISAFSLMRYPRLRRPQFRESGAFSVKESLIGAVFMLIIIVLMILIQGSWGRNL